jgi:hypothetical protein
MPGLVQNPIGMVNPLHGFVQVDGLPQKQSGKNGRCQHGNHNHTAEQRFEFRVLHRNQSLFSGGRPDKFTVPLACGKIPHCGLASYEAETTHCAIGEYSAFVRQ